MARQQRAAAGAGDADPMDRLAEMLNGALRRPDRFKLSKFDGTGDVELFLADFEAVRAANAWDDASALLHLKTSLTGTATDCKRGADLPQVQNALRLRFGMTPKQARDQLDWLRREPGQSLHALASEVDRLVGIGFPEIPEPGRTSFVISRFKKALDHKGLEQHLLAVQTETLAATVRAADEFLGVAKVRPKHQVHAISSEETTWTDLAAVLKMMQETQLLILKQMEDKGHECRGSDKRFAKDRACFNCDSKDHIVRDCPEPDRRIKNQGNGQSPQQ